MAPPLPAPVERSNEAWLTALRAPPPDGDAARGDLRAFLLTALRRALGPRAAPHLDDFAQDATLRVLHHLDTFRGDSRFLTWATAIAIRLAMSELRKAHWKDLSLDTLTHVHAAHAAHAAPADPPDPSPRANPEQSLALARVHAALDRAIQAALTDHQRTIITAELRGVPPDVLAAQLHTTRNAIYKAGHDARRALLTALTADGIDATTLHWVFAPADGAPR